MSQVVWPGKSPPPSQWWQPRGWLGLALVLLLGGDVQRGTVAAHPQVPAASDARVVEHFAPVYGGPGAEYPLIWRLYEGTQGAVLGETAGASGTRWHRI